MFRYDLRTGLSGAPSNLPGGTVLSGTSARSGSWVDCDLMEGQVYAEAALGAVAGAPTSFTATVTMNEADDSSGTNVQAVAQSTSVVLTAGSTRGMANGQRTKRYVQAVVTVAFTGGTTPTIPFSSEVLGVLRRAGNTQT